MHKVVHDALRILQCHLHLLSQICSVVPEVTWRIRENKYSPDTQQQQYLTHLISACVYGGVRILGKQLQVHIQTSPSPRVMQSGGFEGQRWHTGIQWPCCKYTYFPKKHITSHEGYKASCPSGVSLHKREGGERQSPAIFTSANIFKRCTHTKKCKHTAESGNTESKRETRSA